MKLRYPIFFVIFFSSCFLVVYAGDLFITSLMPNTDDDTNNEYIELTNFSQEPLYLSGSYLKDKSEKIYIFGESDNIVAGESKKYYRPQTKITLNNTDEELYLYDEIGNVQDYFAYSTSIKNIPIPTLHLPDQIDTVPTQEENTGGTSSGMIENFPIGESTGSINTGTGINADTSTGDYMSQLEAINLYYSDLDDNGKIDSLEIEFNDAITGSLLSENIMIYSNTGGLSLHKIDTTSGLINDFSMSGNILTLNLIEQDNFKTDLHINNSTTSDLRVKTFSGVGIVDDRGIEAKSITLTSSFDDYRNVFKRILSEPGETQSGIILDSAGTGVTDAGEIPLRPIPDIILGLQLPSYIIKSSSNEYAYDCDNLHDDCRANFTMEESFSGILNSSDFGCSIEIGGTDILNTCNPSTIIFSTGATELTFNIFEKINQTNRKIKTIFINNKQDNIAIPDPIIVVQSGLDGGYNCDKSECSVNFDGESSFTEYSSRYGCLWNFGGGVYAEGSQNQCNPSYIKYLPGSYMISFKIFEKLNPDKFKESYLRVNNIYSPIQSSAGVGNDIFKIILQGVTISKNKRIEGDTIYYSTSDYCSMNFNVNNTYEKESNIFSYFWDFGNSIVSDKKNPPSFKYQSGSYVARLKGIDSNGNVLEDSYNVECIKTQSEKTIKSDILKLTDNELEDYKEFDKIFAEMLSETQDEISFEKTLDKLLDMTQKEIDFILNFKIKLQGKQTKNLSFGSNTVNCKTEKACSINLAFDTKKIDGYTYVWNFGNGQTFKGADPKAIKYTPGKYLATLTVFDDNKTQILKKGVKIIVSKIVPVKKIPKVKTPKVTGKISVSSKNNKVLPSIHLNTLEKEDIFASLSVIIVIALGLVYFSKRRDKIMT